MGKGKVMTPEQCQRAIELHRSGVKTSEIARQIGKSYPCVHNFLRSEKCAAMAAMTPLPAVGFGFGPAMGNGMACWPASATTASMPLIPATTTTNEFAAVLPSGAGAPPAVGNGVGPAGAAIGIVHLPSQPYQFRLTNTSLRLQQESTKQFWTCDLPILHDATPRELVLVLRSYLEDCLLSSTIYPKRKRDTSKWLEFVADKSLLVLNVMVKGPLSEGHLRYQIQMTREEASTHQEEGQDEEEAVAPEQNENVELNVIKSEVVQAKKTATELQAITEPAKEAEQQPEQEPEHEPQHEPALAVERLPVAMEAEQTQKVDECGHAEPASDLVPCDDNQSAPVVHEPCSSQEHDQPQQDAEAVAEPRATGKGVVEEEEEEEEEEENGSDRSEQVYMRLVSDQSVWKVEQTCGNTAGYFDLDNQTITVLRKGYYQLSLKLPTSKASISVYKKPVVYRNKLQVASFRGSSKACKISEMVWLNRNDVLSVGMLRDPTVCPPCQLSLLCVQI